MKRRFLGVTIFICLLAMAVPASSATVNYTYDQMDRLVGVAYGTGVTITYSYDAVGNMSNLTVSGAISPTVIYVSTSCSTLAPCYPTIQGALNAAVNGDTIKAALGTYPEEPVWGKTGAVTFIGGWNTDFTLQSGTTSMYSPKATGGGGVKIQPNVKIIPKP